MRDSTFPRHLPIRRTCILTSTVLSERAAIPSNGGFDPEDDGLYASDSFRLQVIRIDVDSGERETVIGDETLFNFP